MDDDDLRSLVQWNHRVWVVLGLLALLAGVILLSVLM